MQVDNIDAGSVTERGLALHRSGRLEEAAAAYREALAAASDTSEIKSLLGLTLAQLGRVDEGLPYLEQAVAADPDQAGFRLNLALGLLIARKVTRAEEEVKAVVDREQRNPRAWELLGDIAAGRSDLATAVLHWRRALGLRFSLPLALKLVRQQIRNSQFEKAKIVLADLVPHFSTEPEVHAVNCELLAALRDWAAVERVATFMTTRFPDYRGSWKWLATALFETGRYPEAAAAFRRVVEAGPPDMDELAAYAGLCVHALAFDDAVAALDEVAMIDPEHPGMLQRRALVHLYHGRFAEAVDCSRRCLARDPGNASAYTTLTRASRGRLTDAELEAVMRIAERPDAPLDQRIPAAFAAGHVLDARGDAAAAMACYRRAHELSIERDRLEGHSYDRAASEARAAKLPAQLDLPPLPAQPPGSPRPIFIVGMPRSGTTLAECVLGAHPAVVPCGERMAMRQVLHAWLSLQSAGRSADADALAAWREAVLRGLPEPGGATHFTDKHPLNFEAVGLVARMFPDAPIVWMRRDPVETCLSVYRQEFNKRWGFVHRLADIGHYCGLHERVMAQWMARLPGRIIEIRYESLAADFAHQAQALVEAAGLAWDPCCLEFQASERPIATFSTVEAREPVTVRRGRAARYRSQLDELLAALAAEGIALDGGA